MANTRCGELGPVVAGPRFSEPGAQDPLCFRGVEDKAYLLMCGNYPLT